MMKQFLIILVLGFGLSVTASAQSKKAHKKTANKHVAVRKSKLSSSANHAALDQRKMYHWKDGQSATPTGNEATGINETQAVSKETDKNKGGGKRGHGLH